MILFCRFIKYKKLHCMLQKFYVAAQPHRVGSICASHGIASSEKWFPKACPTRKKALAQKTYPDAFSNLGLPTKTRTATPQLSTLVYCINSIAYFIQGC